MRSRLSMLAVLGRNGPSGRAQRHPTARVARTVRDSPRSGQALKGGGDGFEISQAMGREDEHQGRVVRSREPNHQEPDAMTTTQPNGADVAHGVAAEHRSAEEPHLASDQFSAGHCDTNAEPVCCGTDEVWSQSAPDGIQVSRRLHRSVLAPLRRERCRCRRRQAHTLGV